MRFANIRRALGVWPHLNRRCEPLGVHPDVRFACDGFVVLGTRTCATMPQTFRHRAVTVLLLKLLSPRDSANRIAIYYLVRNQESLPRTDSCVTAKAAFRVSCNKIERVTCTGMVHTAVSTPVSAGPRSETLDLRALTTCRAVTGVCRTANSNPPLPHGCRENTPL